MASAASPSLAVATRASGRISRIIEAIPLKCRGSSSTIRMFIPLSFPPARADSFFIQYYVPGALDRGHEGAFFNWVNYLPVVDIPPLPNQRTLLTDD